MDGVRRIDRLEWQMMEWLEPQRKLMANAKAAEKPSSATTSTTQEFKIFEISADDLIVMRIDKKDPERVKVFEAIAKVFEVAHRDAEHSQARAYAQMV